MIGNMEFLCFYPWIISLIMYIQFYPVNCTIILKHFFWLVLFCSSVFKVRNSFFFWFSLWLRYLVIFLFYLLIHSDITFLLCSLWSVCVCWTCQGDLKLFPQIVALSICVLLYHFNFCRNHNFKAFACNFMLMLLVYNSIYIACRLFASLKCIDCSLKKILSLEMWPWHCFRRQARGWMDITL